MTAPNIDPMVDRTIDRTATGYELFPARKYVHVAAILSNGQRSARWSREHVSGAWFAQDGWKRVGRLLDEPLATYAESVYRALSEPQQADPREQWRERARELGREAGRAAGSWAADGNTSAEHIRMVLTMIEEGDAGASDYLPREPNLSGEWAGDPSPWSLALDIIGEDFEPDDGDALADAWDEGVRETFEVSCVSTLRGFLPEPDRVVFTYEVVLEVVGMDAEEAEREADGVANAFTTSRDDVRIVSIS